MTIWKNIHTDPPTPGIGIRVTDGQSVFVGQIVTSNIPNHTWFMGTCLDDGAQICISPDDLTEWMPLPASQEAKTLEDLGYEEQHHDSLSKSGRAWVNGDNLETIIHDKSGTWKMKLTTAGVEPQCLLDDEILALARMIEEEQK